MKTTLRELNAASPEAFVAALGAIYEHSPWVAESVLPQRPFASLDELARAMREAVAKASDAAKLELIRAHPQLAGKAAIAGELTEHSTREQSGAGLDRCSPEEYARLTQLNDAYQRKFGFPFILAVRGHTRTSIIEAMARRVENDAAVERAEALAQIDRIAAFRLGDLLGD
jgi:2-oxo-4-hydroxy-4-carboxy-5-ureidoimidazoline decarboxylase